MSVSKIRAILAVIIVSVFMIIFGYLSIYPFLTEEPVDLGSHADFIMKISSVFTGIIGLIIGFYFGKRTTYKGE